MRSHGFSLKRCLLDAMFSGLIALIILAQLRAWYWTGIALTLPDSAGWMVGTVMVGRFLLSAF